MRANTSITGAPTWGWSGRSRTACSGGSPSTVGAFSRLRRRHPLPRDVAAGRDVVLLSWALCGKTRLIKNPRILKYMELPQQFNSRIHSSISLCSLFSDSRCVNGLLYFFKQLIGATDSLSWGHEHPTLLDVMWKYVNTFWMRLSLEPPDGGLMTLSRSWCLCTVQVCQAQSGSDVVVKLQHPPSPSPRTPVPERRHFLNHRLLSTANR